MKGFKKHIEWSAFLVGLILMASMSPYEVGESFCLLERLGFAYCPGEGLGHSIAFLFRGEIMASLNANFMGPITVVVLSFRILSIWKELITERKLDLQEINNV